MREIERKKKGELQDIDTVNRNAHYGCIQLLFGTDRSCLQVRDLKGFIYSADLNICLNTYLYMNEQLKSQPHSGH